MARSTTTPVTENDCGQRLDNFLLAKDRSIPKSRIYRAIRSGEVRVNKKRAKADYRLVLNDVVRLPPLFSDQSQNVKRVANHVSSQHEVEILYETEDYLMVNKPAGEAVHAGSKISSGIIDHLSHHRGVQLYLVHRLDRDVSGCLLIAKSRKALNQANQEWQNNRVTKIYHALVFQEGGMLEGRIQKPLADQSGREQSAETMFMTKQSFKDNIALLSVRITTGRKHQIRRHLASIDCPIIGDKKYGDFEKNRSFSKAYKQTNTFLHAHELRLTVCGTTIDCTADYPDWFNETLAILGR